jgi:hypothetical protein
VFVRVSNSVSLFAESRLVAAARPERFTSVAKLEAKEARE